MMKALLLYIILILSFDLQLKAESVTETSALDPELMQAQTKWAINLMRSKHYIKDEINQLEGNAIISAYLEVFDSSKLSYCRFSRRILVHSMKDHRGTFRRSGISPALRPLSPESWRWLSRRPQSVVDIYR